MTLLVECLVAVPAVGGVDSVVAVEIMAVVGVAIERESIDVCPCLLVFFFSLDGVISSAVWIASCHRALLRLDRREGALFCEVSVSVAVLRGVSIDKPSPIQKHLKDQSSCVSTRHVIDGDGSSIVMK